MKIKIASIAKGKVNTKFGEKDSYRFTNETDGITYSSFYNPTVASWKVGDEVETEVAQNGKYWNIVTPKSDNRSSTGANVQISSQLDRIEAKIDQLLRGDSIVIPIKMGSPNTSSTLPKDIPQMPYADSPHPSDEDAPF